LGSFFVCCSFFMMSPPPLFSLLISFFVLLSSMCPTGSEPHPPRNRILFSPAQPHHTPTRAPFSPPIACRWAQGPLVSKPLTRNQTACQPRSSPPKRPLTIGSWPGTSVYDSWAVPAHPPAEYFQFLPTSSITRRLNFLSQVFFSPSFPFLRVGY